MWFRTSLLFVSLSLWACSLEHKFTIENSNFTLDQASALPENSDDESYLYNYNRLRLKDTISSDGYYITAIGDIVNYLGSEFIQSPNFKYIELLKPDIPFETRTNFHTYDDKGVVYAKLHRLYAGYQEGKHSTTLGIQKITMGAGRIWTPTDLYNPKNSFALEPDEVFGVLALTYAYAPSSLSNMRAIVSMKEDKSYKYALSYKAFLDFADFAVNFIYSDTIEMYGYEAEGNFFDTGAEWRSEGGYYVSKSLDSEFYQAILGFDYGFQNGITWTVEGYYSSEVFTYEEILANIKDDILNNLVQSHFYLGSSLSYSFDLAWSGSLMYIESFADERSRFVVPSLTYTINDNHIVSLSAMLNDGSKQSEFGAFGSSYFFNWKWSY